jgi:hypothetical protein
LWLQAGDRNVFHILGFVTGVCAQLLEAATEKAVDITQSQTSVVLCSQALVALVSFRQDYHKQLQKFTGVKV